MAHDVFISYSSNDQHAALAVLHGLEAAGIRCWMAPRDIPPGAVWAQSIMDGIRGCKVMVVVFSASANKSSHVLNEVDAAVRKGAVVVPFRIQDVMPEGAMEYHLRSLHWLDALTPDLAGHTARLAEQVRALLASITGPRPTPTPPPRPMPEDLPRRAKSPPQPPKVVEEPVEEERDVTPREPRPPLSTRVKGILGGAIVLLVAVLAWLFTRERPLYMDFSVREVSSAGGSVATLRATSSGLHFSQGNATSQSSARSDGGYAQSFPANSARPITVEQKLTHERPGRVVAIPIVCSLTGRSGQVMGAVTIDGRIQPEWKESFHSAGLNAPAGGWQPGHYRVDCSYGGKAIGRDWFDIVAATGTPPAVPNAVPPPSAAPETPGPAVTAFAEAPQLKELHARVTTIRLFEADSRAPVQDQRVYTTVFAAADTRAIHVEVTLAFDSPIRRMNAGLNCRFLRDRTIEIGRVRLNFSLEPAYQELTEESGYGRGRPGTWAQGSYVVACDDGMKTVGQVGFEVR